MPREDPRDVGCLRNKLWSELLWRMFEKEKKNDTERYIRNSNPSVPKASAR